MYWVYPLFGLVVYYLALRWDKESDAVAIGFCRWITEYQVDGYQFHSLASMIYTHNGFAPFNSGFDE